jgi:hypothetical protein
MAWFFVVYALGPALLGYSVAYWLRNPQDWQGPALVSALSLLGTFVSHRWATRQIIAHPRFGLVPYWRLLQIAGLVTGLLLAWVVYFILLP